MSKLRHYPIIIWQRIEPNALFVAVFFLVWGTALSLIFYIVFIGNPDCQGYISWFEYFVFYLLICMAIFGAILLTACLIDLKKVRKDEKRRTTNKSES